MTRPLRARLVSAVAIFVALGSVLIPAQRAFAHVVGVSSGEYRLDGRVLYGEIGMANRELATWLPAIDTNHDGLIDPDEVSVGRDIVARALLAGMIVSANATACSGSLERAWVMEDDGRAVFQVRFACPENSGGIVLQMPMLAALTPGHRQLARLFRAGKAESKVLDAAHATWTIGETAPTRSTAQTAWSLFKLGVEHILTGADHLVFLLGLIAVGGSLRSLFGVVTAFTVAHSITLALAALSVFAPSPRVVEPAIALSIAYVGIENLFVKDASKRWRITFPFGLVHGFGFAGALHEIALPRAQIPMALVSFNVGVEVGQVAVLSILLPLMLTARHAPWFGTRGVKALSASVAVGGAALFIVRLVSPGLG